MRLKNQITQKKEKKLSSTRNKGGRPRKTLSDYLSGDWQQVIFEMSSRGCSDVEIRAHFCWDGKSFNHMAWDAMLDREEEFLSTIKKAKVLCEAWWQKVSRKSLHDNDFQTGNWYANMKNRFGWRDNKVDVKIDNSKHTHIDISSMDDQGRASFIQDKLNVA